MYVVDSHSTMHAFNMCTRYISHQNGVDDDVIHTNDGLDSYVW